MTTFKLAKECTLSQTATDRYNNLNQRGRVILTYVWIDPFMNKELMRSKCRVVDEEPANLSDVPEWSTTSPEAFPRTETTPVVELVLRPVAWYPDPFLLEPNKLVLCDILRVDRSVPSPGNCRVSCEQAMEKAKDFDLWFGIEQEFYLTEIDESVIGHPKHGIRSLYNDKTPFGVGLNRVGGRQVINAFTRACMHAGIKICGNTPEMFYGQWEFQIGICYGIEAADHLWMARYILLRTAEDFGLAVNFQPNVLGGLPYSASCMNVNISTKAMRTPGTGLKAMDEAAEKLRPHHLEHVRRYDPNGSDVNREKLAISGKKFWAVGDRKTTIRAPATCNYEKCGYIEDMRPGGNADPYVCTEILVRTICLDEK